MRTLVFFASPHPDGHTAGLVSEYTKNNSNLTICNLYALSPQPCIDCGECARHEHCTFHDLDAVMAEFENAECVIFAFPIYNMSFPSPMKALFDRFQRYYNARFCLGLKPPIKKCREAVLLISCGRAFRECESFLLKQIKQAFSVLNLELKDIKICEDTD